MFVKSALNAYNLLLSFGAFYLGASMLLEKGVFETFPQGWTGVMPFNNWAGLALFGIIVFGAGNASASVYGFIKKDQTIFIMTATMGALLLFCTVTGTVLAGEWYLPTGAFFILGLLQLLMGLFCLVPNAVMHK